MKTNYTPTTGDLLRVWCSDIARVTPMPETVAEFYRWLAKYQESVIDEVEDHLVLRDQFTERTLTVIDELRKDYSAA